MSHEAQRSRVALVATALTCLLVGLIGGGAAVYRQWQGKLADADFLKSCLKQLDGQGGPAGPQGTPAALVRVSHARMETVQPEKPVVGRLRQVRRATVASEVTGIIAEMGVEEGSAVTGGKTVLARVDDTWTRLAFTIQQAKIEAIEAQLKKDQANLARIKASLEMRVATPKEYDDQFAEADQRRAELKEAKAQLEELQERLRRLEIIAPFDGWVTRKHAELGERLSLGSPVMDIVSRGTIYAEVNVPESMINGLAVGMDVPVRVDPLDKAVMGKLAAINPYGAAASRTFPVLIALDDLGGDLKVNMSVTAVMPDGRRGRRTMVAKDAVLTRPDGSTVWVVADDGTGQLRGRPVPVDVTATVGGRYAVRPLTKAGGGILTDNCPVVIEGAERLYPNQAIRVLQEQEGPSARAMARPGT